MADSSKEKTQETPAVHYPCYFLEAWKAILKCLGVEIINQENCSGGSDQKVKITQTTHQASSSSSTTDQQSADPSSTTTLNAGADLTNEIDPTVSLAAPSRPGVDPGTPPQTN